MDTLVKKMNTKILIIFMVRVTICFSLQRRALCLASISMIIHRSTMISHRQALTRLRSGKELPGAVADRTMKEKGLVPEVDRDREIVDNMVTIRITRGMLEATDKE